MKAEETNKPADDKKKTLPGGITEDQLEAWEKEYGKRNDYVKRGSVENLRVPGHKLYFYFRKPDKSVIALAMTRSNEGAGSPMKGSDILRTNCLLHAEAELIAESQFKGEYEVAMGKIIGDAFPIPIGEIEKI